MIQRNNNLTVLPFYSKLEHQHRFKPYAFGNVYPLIADTMSLMPFQVSIKGSILTGNILTSAQLVCINTSNERSDITNALNRVLRVDNSTAENIIVYSGNAQLNAAPGQYYIKLVISTGEILYSEIITLVNNITDYLKIEWWDEENLVFDSGTIIYNGYKNTLYLDTDIGKPEYKFEEEGKERDGYFFAEKQLSEKVYKFVFLAPEFVCDAFRFVRLSDNIVVHKNGIEYTVDSLLAEVNWQDQGDLADVSVEFRTGTAVKKIAAAWHK